MRIGNRDSLGSVSSGNSAADDTAQRRSATFTFAVTVPAQNGSAVREVNGRSATAIKTSAPDTGNAVYRMSTTSTAYAGDRHSDRCLRQYEHGVDFCNSHTGPSTDRCHHVLTRPSKSECGDDLHDSGHGTGGHQRGQHGHRFR